MRAISSTARADYGKLDRPGAPVQLRLNQIVVRARNAPGAIEIAYTRASGGGAVTRVKAKDCVLASWNMMIPYLCPEMPAPQKQALHQLVKTPLVYTSVALRDWEAFKKLGIRSVTAPGGYHSTFRLNQPVNIGNYESPRDPQSPMLVHMLRTPAKPGLPEREQHKAGRAELLATPFETFEREIRAQLSRTLSPGGFDPARDIVGIAVNRWPHGYAPEYNSLIDGSDNKQTPNLIARRRFGRIAIANSDSGLGAYTDVAINQSLIAANVNEVFWHKTTRKKAGLRQARLLGSRFDHFFAAINSISSCAPGAASACTWKYAGLGLTGAGTRCRIANLPKLCAWLKSRSGPTNAVASRPRRRR